MHIVHIGSQRNQIQTGDFFRKQPTFQTCMDGNHLGFLAEFFHPDLLEDAQQLRIGVILPAGVIMHADHLCTAKTAQNPNLFAHSILSAFHRAAHCIINENMILICFQNPDITGGFHQSIHIGIHCLYTIGQKPQQCNYIISRFCRQHLGCFRHLLRCHQYIAFAVFIFLSEHSFCFLNHSRYGLHLFRRNYNNRLCFPTDGIIHIAAICAYQCKIYSFTQLKKKSAQKHIRTCPLQMNIRTGMTALQAANMNGKGCACLLFLFFNRQIHTHPSAAAAAYHQMPFLLGIHI